MKKFLVLLIILSIATFIIVGCAKQSTTTAPALTSTPASTSPKVTAPATTSTPASTSPKVTSTTATPVYGGTLRIVMYSSPLYIGDPALITDSNSQMGAIPGLEALVVSDNAGHQTGVLSTNWTVAADGKSIIFSLRKGVKFHDGTDFNATAAKWNMDRYLAANPGTVPQWASIDVIDDYTIRLNLKSFVNTVLNTLESSAGMMVSPTAAQKNGIDWMKTNEAGTGPFIMKNFTRDVSLQYVRNDSYWGAKPYLDGVTFNIIADANTARLAFQAGQADVVSSSTDAITADLVKAGYKLEARPGPLMTLILDSKHDTSPFSKLGVRQAISYAIDRDAMAKTLGYGYWEVVNQPNAAYQFGHIDNSQVPYKYDVAKAKSLLASAGYANGFSSQIITSSTFAKDPVLAIQANLKDVGITVDINVVEVAAWNNYVNKGWDNSLLWATQGATDTNYAAFLDRYFSATATRYPVLAKPAGLTDLISQAIATPDYATEKSLCQQAVKLMVDDATTIPIYIQPASYVEQPNVHDTNFSNLGGSGFRWTPQLAWISK